MKKYYIWFYPEHAILAAIVVLLFIVAALMVGYVKGVKAAERKFCDDYLQEHNEL